MKQPPHATPLDDAEGLLHPNIASREDLNRAEFANINKVLPKYLLEKPGPETASFEYGWLLKLHKEMFGDVWEWAGKIRKSNLSIGIDRTKITEELSRFVGDLKSWQKYRHDLIEISAKIHHRLVWIHPFKNGNGRWARMAANIFLRQENSPLLQWPEEESIVRGGLRQKYIQALKKADNSDFVDLIQLHKKYSQ